MPIIVEPEAPQGFTLQEMAEEVYAQGFDDFQGDSEKEERIKRWLNQAYQELCLFKAWPFLEAEYEGPLPHDFENLGHVLDVVSVNNRWRLRFADRRNLVRFDPLLEGNGNVPERWYVEGEETIVVYPKASSETFRVRFVIFPEELKEPTDKPIVPARFQYIIWKGAQRQAYMSRDAYTAAQLVEEQINQGKEMMVKSVMRRNYDEERKIVRTGRGWNGYWGW